MKNARHFYQQYATWINSAVFCAVVWGFFLAAFWPGLLSFDSLNQFDQAARNTYTDWHPVFHTLNIKFLLFFWKSPASVAIFQILAMSVVAGYGFHVLRKKGAPRIAILLACLLFSINLINGLMVITLWKDVLYSIFVLLLSILVIQVIDSEGAWLKSTWNWALLGITGGLVSLYRHNGVPIPVATFLLVAWVYKAYWRSLLKAMAVVAAMLLIVHGAVYPLFHVQKDSAQSFGVIFLHPLDAQIHNLKDYQASLSPADIQYLNSIYPLKKGWDYNCYDATIFFYKGVKFPPLQRDPLMALDILARLTVENPQVLYQHFYCLSSFVWRLDQPNGVFLETVLDHTIDASALDKTVFPTQYEAWVRYKRLIAQKSVLPGLRQAVLDVESFSKRVDPGKVLWRPAIYLYFLIAAVLVAAIRNKNAKLMLVLTPVIVQTVVIMFVAQVEAVRYQYPVYLVSMAFSLPLLFYRQRRPAEPPEVG